MCQFLFILHFEIDHYPQRASFHSFQKWAWVFAHGRRGSFEQVLRPIWSPGSVGKRFAGSCLFQTKNVYDTGTPRVSFQFSFSVVCNALQVAMNTARCEFTWGIWQTTGCVGVSKREHQLLWKIKEKGQRKIASLRVAVSYEYWLFEENQICPERGNSDVFYFHPV